MLSLQTSLQRLLLTKFRLIDRRFGLLKPRWWPVDIHLVAPLSQTRPLPPKHVLRDLVGSEIASLRSHKSVFNNGFGLVFDKQSASIRMGRDGPWLMSEVHLVGGAHGQVLAGECALYLALRQGCGLEVLAQAKGLGFSVLLGDVFVVDYAFTCRYLSHTLNQSPILLLPALGLLRLKVNFAFPPMRIDIHYHLRHLVLHHRLGLRYSHFRSVFASETEIVHGQTPALFIEAILGEVMLLLGWLFRLV